MMVLEMPKQLANCVAPGNEEVSLDDFVEVQPEGKSEFTRRALLACASDDDGFAIAAPGVNAVIAMAKPPLSHRPRTVRGKEPAPRICRIFTGAPLCAKCRLERFVPSTPFLEANRAKVAVPARSVLPPSRRSGQPRRLRTLTRKKGRRPLSHDCILHPEGHTESPGNAPDGYPLAAHCGSVA
jgi:hypothetical protein